MGGNIFDNTSPIKKERIEPTIKQFALKLNAIFPAVNFEFHLLGSTGKKDISNDIDLALSENEIFNRVGKIECEGWNAACNKWSIDPYRLKFVYKKIRQRAKTATIKQSKLRAMLNLISTKLQEEGIACSDKNSGSGSLFCCFPQFDQNGETGETVQIDINFGDIDWLLFSYHAEVYPNNIKGLHRTQLLVALFSYKRRTFRHGSGIYNSEIEKYEATTPSEAVELLNTLYEFTNPEKFQFTREILNNFLDIFNCINLHLSQEELYKIYDIYLKILDSTRCDIPYFLQEYWKTNQERLDLKGNFLPLNSNLYGRGL